jgi:hypothetical protein
MRTIFSIIAAISLVISFAFIGIAAVTMAGSPKSMSLGEDAEHTFAIKINGFDIDYEGRLKTFGPNGFKTETTTYPGVTIDHQTRPADARRNIPAGEGKLIEVSSLYPIGVFGILPLIWVLTRKGKKKAPPAESETSPAA